MTTPPALPDALAAYRAAAWTRAAGVAAAIMVAVLVTAPIGWWVAGPAALWAAATAAAICLAGSLLSIAIGNFTATPEEVQAHVVFGMFLRMSLGLVACLAVYTQEGALVEGGMVYYLLAYYPLALLVETVQDVVALQSLFPSPRTRALS